MRRRIAVSIVGVVDRVRGFGAGNTAVHRIRFYRPCWSDCQLRLEQLERQGSSLISHFVDLCLERTSDPVVIIGLARHPLSRTAVKEWLERNDIARSETLANRLSSDSWLAAAIAGAGERLLASPTGGDFADWVLDLNDVPSTRFEQLKDSMGVSLSRVPTGNSGNDARPKHQLIVAESFADVDFVGLLLPGAEKTTLIGLTDTLGQADLATVASWPGVGKVEVEHTRSRITRFSQEYIDLHRATARRSKKVVQEIASIDGLVDPAGQPSLEVEIADFLFFQALKVRSLEVLLDDKGIDRIVVALGNHRPQSEYIRLLAGVGGLIDDSRVEFVSISRSPEARCSFWTLLDGIEFPRERVVHRPLRRTSAQRIVRKLDDQSKRLACSLRRLGAMHRPWICIVTADNSSYLESTASYASEIARDRRVAILHMGTQAEHLRGALHALEAKEVEVDSLKLEPAPLQPLGALLSSSHAQFILDESEHSAGAERSVVWSLNCVYERLMSTVVAPAILRHKVVAQWLAGLGDSQQLPDAVVLTPIRHPSVSAVAPLARRSRVPTVALEPHLLDGAYCRYTKVTTDYYGVVCDYFRESASRGFGVPLDRTFSVGSPRQVTPEGYEHAAAQSRARALYSAETGHSFRSGEVYLTFFCQPSGWRHVSSIWASILSAAAATQSRVLLKMHREESSSRLDRYIADAADRGLHDRVVVFEGDAHTAIDIADIVLTAYSAAGLEAAIRGVPLICVTDGTTRYPLDLSSMTEAPIAHSADELTALINGFRADPEPLLSRARSLSQREPQFIDGPGDRIRELISLAVARGPSGIRSAADVADSLFLDGPHTVFGI